MEFFRAYKASDQAGLTIPTYFIESTAPDNVDDTAPIANLPKEFEKYLTEIGSEQALKEIAVTLATGENPNLVVMVHGFNNPGPDVLKMYTGAAIAIGRDAAIEKRKGLVCIGYRWPSEKMLRPWAGTWDALPTLPTWALYCGILLAALPFLLFYFAPESAHWAAVIFGYLRNSFGDHLVTMLGLTLAGLVLTAALLRAIVYFRDNYRATNFGVPDLVHIIRAIDGKIGEIRGTSDYTNDVQLSFIGHSMGGFVVTNTIRVLSDVFATEVKRIEAYGAAGDEAASPNIGRVFQLKRFVLASPDIPAETLATNRGNFLASALTRFDEAYLFSNEGDEVLRQISTLANYFVYPTKSRNHGFRLGNVEILSSDFGIIDVERADILNRLRVGNLTLKQLCNVLEDATEQRQQKIKPQGGAKPPVWLPERFTYFDCTDYTDQWTDYADSADAIKPERALLTFAKRRKRNNAKAKLRWYSHLRLLIAYLAYGQKPNVHGGYFEGELSQQLIYRLACLGYSETINAYKGEAALADLCRQKQIRVLISPELRGMRAA
jgi:hypothetical protein